MQNTVKHLNNLWNGLKKLRAYKSECKAETPQDIKAGYNFGAKGIGLVRTEHMFFGAERLIEMRDLF